MGIFSHAPAKPTNTPSTKKVLIVEDETDLANALADKLTSAGYQVFQARNGQEGIDMAKNFHPDVMLLDLMMPVLDGKTMLKHLRDTEEFKHLPVIVLTNAGNVDNIREMNLYFEVSDFLIKSNISLDEVVSKVNQYAPLPPQSGS